VKWLIASVIHRAKAKHRKVGICGQAPSENPEFARFLVEEGIDSSSLISDVVLRTTIDLLETEKAVMSSTIKCESPSGWIARP
jgi:pyruvate,water dikinase